MIENYLGIRHIDERGRLQIPSPLKSHYRAIGFIFPRKTNNYQYLLIKPENENIIQNYDGIYISRNIDEVGRINIPGFLLQRVFKKKEQLDNNSLEVLVYSPYKTPDLLVLPSETDISEFRWEDLKIKE